VSKRAASFREFVIDLGGVGADAVRGPGGVVVGRVAAGGACAAGDLARLDVLLSDPELLVAIAVRWDRELAQAGTFFDRGRPSLAMETYVRLMVLKHRCGCGVGDVDAPGFGSLYLRRFCRLGWHSGSRTRRPCAS
jgi:hypothetical protein